MEKRVYSEEFKKAAVKKFLMRGSKTVGEIERELGIGNSALYAWKAQYATGLGMKKPDIRPQDRSVQEKIKLVIEFENLPQEQRGEFLRKEGLHTEHLEQWRRTMESGFDLGSETSKVVPVSRAEIQQLKAHNKELERELRRKEKALAEAAALLVLQKKAQAIWGSSETE